VVMLTEMTEGAGIVLYY